MTDLLLPLAVLGAVVGTFGIVYGVLVRPRSVEIRRLRGVIRTLHEAERRERNRQQ